MAAVLALLFLSVGLLALALIAGLFFAFSVLVMPGLNAAPPTAAVPSMQAINDSVNTPLFAFAFFGPLAATLLVVLVAWLGGLEGTTTFALLSLFVYALGAFGVTLFINVPMNERLAFARPSEAEAAATWRGYADRWTFWNHVRTVASTLAGLLLLAAGVAALS